MPQATQLAVRVRVTSPLPAHLGRIPFAPRLDFAALIAATGVGGVLDPNSIEVVDLATGERVAHGRTEDFAYGDAGRLEWVIDDPGHVEYEVRFRAVGRRPPLEPQAHVPMVGLGDLLRHNAAVPRPVVLAHPMKLVDLTGDGRADLAGCWNYYHRPGSPQSGVVCYPRTGPDGSFLFGDLARLRFRGDEGELRHFPGVYTEVDFADWDDDGRLDLVFAERGGAEVAFFLNTGERDGGGLPVFAPGPRVALPFVFDAGLRAVDLDGDGRQDLVANGCWLRNEGPGGWPFVAAAPVDLGSGAQIDFLDLDGDGRLDLVGVRLSDDPSQLGGEPFWRPRQGSGAPAFGPERPLAGMGDGPVTVLSAVQDGAGRGLLVQRDQRQRIDFHAWDGQRAGAPAFAASVPAASVSAVLTLSDQAWPCVCDWNGDGVWDLLIGGGYGWPRVVVNRGTSARPAFAEARRIEATGGPIRLLRDELLHSRHWHNMGYPYPVFVDWDGDGLPDLMLPNETNRIVWYRNVGRPGEPAFAEPRFLAVDGFPDSEERRRESGRDGEDRSLPNHPYPRDPRSPFFWRTGAAFADWNGDGLMDLITHSWERHATLFAQYVDGGGERRLRLAGPVRLADGRLIDDAIVGRQKHWTESFRAVDWDGDGLIDLVYSLAGTGEIYLLRNVGTRSEPLFSEPRPFRCYGEPISFTIHGPNAWAADLNDDGKPDLLGCVEWSVYPFYAHAALEMECHPEYRVGAPQRL